MRCTCLFAAFGGARQDMTSGIMSLTDFKAIIDNVGVIIPPTLTNANEWRHLRYVASK